MKATAIALASAAALLIAGAAPAAVSVTAHVTADNHYGVYTADDSGGGLTFRGRNETGESGSPGTYNWSEAETLSFAMDLGEYVYIAAWDNKVIGGVLGDFETFAGISYTDGSWEVAPTSFTGYDASSALPGDAAMAAEIASIESSGGWGTPYGTSTNGAPWFGIATVPDVDPLATWIWYDSYQYQPFGTVFIFRSKLGLESTSADETTWGGVKKLFR